MKDEVLKSNNIEEKVKYLKKLQKVALGLDKVKISDKDDKTFVRCKRQLISDPMLLVPYDE